MHDDNLPPWTTDRDLEFRDEELDSLEDIENDPWLLDDDSDNYDCLEDRLAPLLDNIT